MWYTTGENDDGTQNHGYYFLQAPLLGLFIFVKHGGSRTTQPKRSLDLYIFFINIIQYSIVLQYKIWDIRYSWMQDIQKSDLAEASIQSTTPYSELSTP